MDEIHHSPPSTPTQTYQSLTVSISDFDLNPQGGDDHFNERSSSISQPNNKPPYPPQKEEEVDLPQLINEISKITTTTTSLICSIQECVAQSSLCHNTLSDLTIKQFSNSITEHCEGAHDEMQYIFDLFGALQLKLYHLSQLVQLLPSFEHELDTILQLLPSLEQRVQLAVQGIKNGTLKYEPPTIDKQQQWHEHINNCYTARNVAVPTDHHNTHINQHYENRLHTMDQSLPQTINNNNNHNNHNDNLISGQHSVKIITHNDRHDDSPITVPVAKLEDFISSSRNRTSSTASSASSNP